MITVLTRRTLILMDYASVNDFGREMIARCTIMMARVILCVKLASDLVNTIA